MQKIFELATFYFILFFGWLFFCLIFVDTYGFEKNCFLNCQGKENEANYFFSFKSTVLRFLGQPWYEV